MSLLIALLHYGVGPSAAMMHCLLRLCPIDSTSFIIPQSGSKPNMTCVMDIDSEI